VIGGCRLRMPEVRLVSLGVARAGEVHEGRGQTHPPMSPYNAELIRLLY